MALPKSLSPENRPVFTWCLYDWANSSFTTLVMGKVDKPAKNLAD